MKILPVRPFAMAWLAAPTLAGGLLLGACNSQPTATEADKTATVVPAETNAASDSAAVTAAGPSAPGEVKPTGPAPAWAPNIKPEMLTVIEALQSFKPKPFPQLTPAQARQQPGATEAVMKVMRDHSIPPPPLNCDTMTTSLMPGVKARVYTPKSGTAPYPVIVYYHGGGWVIATNDTYAASAQALCEQVGAVVVSVEYRKAPENKFPTAHNDAFAAYQYVLKNAASMKGDPAKVAVVGESAGGNMACNVSIMARDKKLALPKYQVLVYPVAGYDMNTPSYQKNTETLPLNKGGMEWFFKHYLRTPADGKDPRISLLSANLKGLPPTTIIAADLDPLLSEGKTLADKLQAAGVKTSYKLYEGVAHEFFGMAAVVPQAKDAQGVAVSDLKGALK
ncbi:alpha/beta hydrolase fold domain-containing protein [Hymenobacter sp. ASUV-10]|uniref:Alpha/beta hydrolase fold domain-containing protein n=1 Tax=Hymenobacter aranciens TaxID=3063996 RepID=A0ABT9BH24_9BACT|nr:alpha/beta hydrolase fold domain-containing protein [Hymenobacter sp. ASUV-10]MDO7877546.1 alpha/beta hydrolase fold domain-containing protein [Hymenobacter sp. ASUV-10]